MACFRCYLNKDLLAFKEINPEKEKNNLAWLLEDSEILAKNYRFSYALSPNNAVPRRMSVEPDSMADK
jgi:hypothetical protein